MAISKRLRFEVLRRDGFKCRYCGTTAAENELRVDHVTPVALGGTDDPANLVAACNPCNTGKSSSSPDAPIVAGAEDTALLWAQAMKQAAAKAADDHKTRTTYRATFETAWNSWTYEGDGGRKTFELPADWRQSIESFRVAGLPDFLLGEIVDAAMTAQYVKKRFNYFAGIAWKRITELQESAREHLEQQANFQAGCGLEALTSSALAVWSALYRKLYGDIPQEKADKFVELVRMHYERGDKDHVILSAAQAAGACADPYLGMYMIHDLERLARITEAVQVWSRLWFRCSSGRANKRTEPTADERSTFETDVDTAIELNVEQDSILHAAAIAGSEASPELADYIPELATHYDEIAREFEQGAKV